ncbi:MAG TPA: hypothetical protein VES20_18240 [Bryobacteraceae bacterium]|nr:hypothetical protein [Bryobacteraceae bacterium]
MITVTALTCPATRTEQSPLYTGTEWEREALWPRRRTESEHRELLKKGQFRLNRVIPVSPRTSIVEAVPE